jgi:ankyrin repeat protein
MSIHNAVRNGNLKRVKELLNQGVNINARDQAGFTPLHAAAFARRLNVVQELLKRGAHVNPRNMWGSTPLHLTRDPQIFHALIEAGANPKYRAHSDPSFFFPVNNNAQNALMTSRAATKWLKPIRKREAEVRKRKAERLLAFSGLLGSVLNKNSIAHIVRHLNNNSLGKIARHLKNLNNAKNARLKRKRNNIK